MEVAIVVIIVFVVLLIAIIVTLRLASRYNWCTCCNDDDDDDDDDSSDERTMDAAEESRVDDVYRPEEAILREDEAEDYKRGGYSEDGTAEEIKSEDYEQFERLRNHVIAIDDADSEEFVVSNMEESLL